MNWTLLGKVHLLLVGLLHLGQLLLILLLLLLHLIHLLLLLLLHLVHLLLLVLDHDHALLLLHELNVLLLLLLLLGSSRRHHRLGTSNGGVVPAGLHLPNVGVLLHHLLLLKRVCDAHSDVRIVRDDLGSYEAVLLLQLSLLLLTHHLVLLHDNVLLNVLSTRAGYHSSRRHRLSGHSMLWGCHTRRRGSQPSR